MLRLAYRHSALAQRTSALAHPPPTPAALQAFQTLQALRAARLSTSARRAADPWLLPNTPEHVEKTTSPRDAPAPTPLPRAGESVDTMRARLVYQSRKRGTLESDLLLSTFAQEQLGRMSAGELHEFDKLMDEPDWDIYYWATGKKAPPERWEGSSVLEKLREHVKNEGKVVRRMPDLS